MKLVTFAEGDRTRLGRLEGDQVQPLDGLAGLGTGTPLDRVLAAKVLDPPRALDTVRLLPTVTAPGKIVCVGLNYREHVEETGNTTPTHPALFTKWTSTLLGPNDDIALPPESQAVDFEGELAVIIGRAGRRIPESRAWDHVLGYAPANDVTMRDFQYRTAQWLPGKAWDRSTPIGPVVTADEIDPGDLLLTTTVNGTEVQRARTSQLIFPIPRLISEISTFTALEPGDIILTGTPSGVGYRREPKLLLAPGDTVAVSIEGVGWIANRVVAEKLPL